MSSFSQVPFPLPDCLAYFQSVSSFSQVPPPLPDCLADFEVSISEFIQPGAIRARVQCSTEARSPCYFKWPNNPVKWR